MESEVTYWYHPESECFFTTPKGDGADEMGDGLCVELDEHEYIRGRIKKIDEDPEHKLPEGISAVIKLAVQWPGDSISGQIWYDSNKRFVNDYPINTSKIIAREPGGIYCTQNNKYLVELIQPNKEPAIG